MFKQNLSPSIDTVRRSQIRRSLLWQAGRAIGCALLVVLFAWHLVSPNEDPVWPVPAQTTVLASVQSLGV